jgi:hypothetical protein
MRVLLAVTFILALAASASSAQDITRLHVYGHPDYAATETSPGDTRTSQSGTSGRPEPGTAATGSTGQRCQAKSNGWGLREYGANPSCD